MLQPIEIRTLSGVRLDVPADKTIEVIAGGISLLSMAARSTSYSLDFDLPRTPTNEVAFGYVSQLSRANKVSIGVVITYGLFQKVATLRVLSFSKNSYSCSISYTDFTDEIKGLQINDILDTITNPILADKADFLDDVNFRVIRNYSFTNSLSEMGVWINCKYLIDLIATELGYTTTYGAAIDLSDAFFFCRDWKYTIENSGSYPISIEFIAQTQYKSCSVILRDVCQVQCLDLEIDEDAKTLNFKRVVDILANTPIAIETLTVTNKQIYSGYAATNKVNYTTGDGIVSSFRNGVFTGDGTGSHEALTIGCVIPKKTEGQFDYTGITESSIVKFIAPVPNDAAWFLCDLIGGGQLSFQLYYADPDFYVLDDYYDFLSDIFTEPIIIDAEGYADTFQLNKIMDSKVITSVRLGGTFYVETMNGNLNTGKIILKLIRL